MKKEDIKIIGEYSIQDKKTGETYHQHHNLITSNGVKWILNRLIFEDTGRITNISMGTGKTTPASTDTGLEKPVTDITQFNITDRTVTDNTLTFKATFKAEDITGASEIGVYTDKQVLVSHDTFNSLVLPSGSMIEVKYSYTITI